MIEQHITQATLSSIETFDSTKSKFKALTESIENAAQIFSQDTLCIVFSKVTGSLVLSANKLKARSPNVTWMELIRELPMQYSAILFDSHATKALAQLEKGLDELLNMYLVHTSEHLSNIYYTSDMSRISGDGLNHYTVVYGLNYRRLKDSVVGHHSTQWKMMEDCSRDICNIDAEYERAKGYYRAKLNTQEASMITEVKTTKQPGPCYKFRGPHSQNNCTNHKNDKNNFQNKTTMWQNYKGSNYIQKSYGNSNNSNMFTLEPYYSAHPKK